MSNSNGITNSTTNATCNCLSGTSWDDYLQQCSLNCLSKDSPNSNGSKYEFNSCYCNNGSVWNYSLRACVLNCYGMPESIGNDGNSKCLCSSGYRWDIHAGQCIKRNSIAIGQFAAQFTKPATNAQQRGLLVQSQVGSDQAMTGNQFV